MNGHFHALIVDDDPHLLRGLQLVLHHEPYHLHTASTGDEAWQFIESHNPDVIVTDYLMPGMRGTELLAKAFQFHPSSTRFLITGSPSLDMAVEAVNNGAISRIFIKPFNTMFLAMAIREAMERIEIARLSAELLKKSQEQQRMVEKLLAEHPGLADTYRTELSESAPVEGEYQPHDSKHLLLGLRAALERPASPRT